MAITADDRQEWANSPVTKEFKSKLEASLMEAMGAWAGEVFIGATAEATCIANATALGGVRVLRELIENISDLANPSREE